MYLVYIIITILVMVIYRVVRNYLIIRKIVDKYSKRSIYKETLYDGFYNIKKSLGQCSQKHNAVRFDYSLLLMSKSLVISVVTHEYRHIKQVKDKRLFNYLCSVRYKERYYMDINDSGYSKTLEVDAYMYSLRLVERLGYSRPMSEEVWVVISNNYRIMKEDDIEP